MGKKTYSASLVKNSFWFAEFRKLIQLLNSGKSMDDIKNLNIQQNIFSAPTKARATQMFNVVSVRVKSLDESFLAMFETSDIATQKIIVLIAIMRTDSLFFDFVYEVYREKLIIGIDIMADSDIQIFFNNKQVQSEKVARWTDYTLKRLGVCYKTLLMEAGVTDRAFGERKILKPILDKRLEDCLIINRMGLFINALTGVI